MSVPHVVPHVAPEPDHPDRERLRRMGRKVRKRLAANPAVQRIATDKAELWAMPRFLGPIECGRLISLIQDHAQPSMTYSHDHQTSVRTSFAAYLDHGEDPFVNEVRQKMNDLLGIDSNQAECLQGQRYTVGQEFKPHLDWFQQRSPGWAREKGNGGQRGYTAMVYLNDVEAGGETDFPRLDIAVAPRAGTLLAWNNADDDGVPNPFTIHAGNPVTRGVKYIVTNWYRCARIFGLSPVAR
jgi:prolyl 4-hydroxylase